MIYNVSHSPIFLSNHLHQCTSWSKSYLTFLPFHLVFLSVKNRVRSLDKGKKVGGEEQFTFEKYQGYFCCNHFFPGVWKCLWIPSFRCRSIHSSLSWLLVQRAMVGNLGFLFSVPFFQKKAVTPQRFQMNYHPKRNEIHVGVELIISCVTVCNSPLCLDPDLVI